MRTVYNHVEFEGNLGRDPEIQYFESGSFVVKFSMAVYQGKEKDGNPKPSVWMQVNAWGFEDAANLTKGDRVHVVGQMGADNWTDRETGKPRSKNYVYLNSKFDGHSLVLVPRATANDEF